MGDIDSVVRLSKHKSHVCHLADESDKLLFFSLPPCSHPYNGDNDGTCLLGFSQWLNGFLHDTGLE